MSPDIADAARSILRQYNEAKHTHHSCWGPHYVLWERGEFYLRPYGGWAHQRYSFECRPEFMPGVEDPLWTFVVMC
jgi:hypothetical protein